MEANEERKKEGYESITIIGWATKPFYDKERKVLHWAKELKFGDQPVNTLNYNVRILGRKGVLVLNAIASMDQYAEVEKKIPQILNAFEYNSGHKYSEFNPSIDKVAMYTVGGLVAGKVLAKVGFFALLLKFWKIIAIALLGASGFIWKYIMGRKSKTNPSSTKAGTLNVPENPSV